MLTRYELIKYVLVAVTQTQGDSQKANSEETKFIGKGITVWDPKRAFHGNGISYQKCSC